MDRILQTVLRGIGIALVSVGTVAAEDAARHFVAHASGFTMQHEDGRTLVTVSNTAPGSTRSYRYLLYRDGAKPEAGDEIDQVIRVPVKRVVALSTTCIPHLKHCGRIDALVGVEQAGYISTPEARERLAEGSAQAVGHGSSLDVERIIALRPDLVISYELGDERAQTHTRLQRAGIPVVMTGSYMEQSPLGRAEWIKFTAAFLDRSTEAARFFHGVDTRYSDLRARAQAAPARPSVLMNAPFKGQWYMPGGRSYAASLVADAGGRYLWAQLDNESATPIAFERVFARAANADVWLNPSAWETREAGLKEDPRFEHFRSFREGRIYNTNGQINPDGGNDIFENGVVRPDEVLADLIHILHPDELPEHRLKWYRKLP